MKKDQVKYATERARDIAKAKIAAFEEAHPTMFKSPGVKEIIKDLQEGAFNVREEALGSKMYLQDFLSIRCIVAKEIPAKENQAMCAAYRKYIQGSLSVILDKLNLGDSKEALELLEQFTKE